MRDFSSNLHFWTTKERRGQDFAGSSYFADSANCVHECLFAGSKSSANSFISIPLSSFGPFGAFP